MGRVTRSIKEFMHATSGYNAFRDAPQDAGYSAGPSMPHNRGGHSSSLRYYNDKSMIGSIYNRLAVDFAQVEFFHARLDPDQDIPIEIIRDALNERLTLRANLDQTAFHMKVDACLTMFEQGNVAVFPVNRANNPSETSSGDILDMRVATIASWFPRRVTINVYDDREEDVNGEPVNGGVQKQLTVTKEQLAIVENPFYNIMNEPNGTLQRLMRKLSIIDSIDEAAGSGKLDLIMQLPYTVRGSKRQEQAEKRRQDLRDQLKDDELGIGYIDVSEKVIQLNRPINNKLLEEIEVLHKAVLDELGLTPEIMNGTASPDALNTYYDRTIEPIATAFALEYKWKFLTQTARTQRQSIEIYRDPLKLIPIGELAEITDKVLRNAAITANELRPKIGYFPSKDPRANELANPNMPVGDQPGATQNAPMQAGAEPGETGEPDELDTEMSSIEETIAALEKELGDGG